MEKVLDGSMVLRAVRGEAAVLLALGLALALPVATAQTCKMEYNGMIMEYPCGSGEVPPDEGSGTQSSWTEDLDILLGVVGILGSVGAAGYTYHRVRTRRRTLTVTLAAIDRAYVDAKSDPGAGIARLTELRAEVRRLHDKGRMDDAHFLELDRRGAQYLAKLRVLELERRFAHLPPLLLAEIRRLLSDGILSATEADLIEVRAAAYRVPEATRAELAELARKWASEDGGATEPQRLAPAA